MAGMRLCLRKKRQRQRSLVDKQLIYFDVLHRFTQPGWLARWLAGWLAGWLPAVAGWLAGWQTGESMPLGMRTQAQCHLAMKAE